MDEGEREREKEKSKWVSGWEREGCELSWVIGQKGRKIGDEGMGKSEKQSILKIDDW